MKKRPSNTNPDTPKASTVRSGYGFTRRFPESPHRDGLRPRATDSGLSKRAFAAILICVCAVVFTAALTACVVAMRISQLPDEEAVTAEPLKTTAVKAMRISSASGFSSGAEAVNACLADGCSCVIIEIKSPDGKLAFTPSVEVPADAVEPLATDPAELTRAFRSAGIRVYAAISCFADDIYARNNIRLAGYTEAPDPDDPDRTVATLWYDQSQSPHAWLSPASDEVVYYLNELISDAAETDPDGIILENVTLPDDIPQNVIFSGEGAEDVNAYAPGFAGRIADEYMTPIGVCENGVRFCRYFADGELPPLFNTSADFFAADLRSSHIPAEARFHGLPYNTSTGYPGFITAAAWAMRDSIDKGLIFIYSDLCSEALLSSVNDITVTIAVG
ncbi:MAG: hypothetical protein K6G90_11935 [Clostridia bacterium]|nr:hypothetical protein [Clostridia bacterium]